MISQSTIDSILAAVRIDALVGEQVKLKHRGTTLIGLCPFHSEKTPSFTVSPVKNTWHCYGCGEGGDAISFVMKSGNLTFPEAVRKLAGITGVKIEDEEPDPEAEAREAEREQIFAINELAARFYRQQLAESQQAADYARNRFPAESLSLWKIGFAPDSWDAFCSFATKEGYKAEQLIASGLVRHSDKKNRLYDFFRNRLMFPIFNRSGRIAGFSGRALTDDKETAKYVNTPDTAVYSKSRELYGIHLAAGAIHANGALIVEGNPDVIRMHEVGADNAVAPCGTSVTKDQLRILRRFTDTVTILTDGDAAGQKALERTGRLCLEDGFKVYSAVLPEDQDPDTFFKSEQQANEWFGANRQNFLILMAARLFAEIGQDPVRKNEAIKEIAAYLKPFDEVTRNVYIEQIAKNHKLKTKLLHDRLRDLDQEDVAFERDDSLPEGVDVRDFERWGFYEHKNCYFVRSKNGTEEVSNFVMKPVFHIEGQDSRRIYDLVNFKGFRIVVDLDMQEMTSIQAFRRNVEGRGNFIFSGNDSQFTRIKSKLYEETRTCSMIKVLGWQKEGFWAWSNGITIPGGGFQETDEYGVVTHEKVNYYIPAYSSIYIDNKSVFLAERKFIYRKRDISMFEWSELFQAVFGENARIGICFWVASVFRDFILFLNKNFPILNLFGPKGTGKSQMAMSLSCLFGEQQIPFNIHNGTKAGLAEHLQQFSNAFAWVDEYKNNLEYDKIETLKSVYDAIGRNRLNEKLQKQTTLVNSAMILSGQEMPTADVALFSRLIFCQFHKTEYSDDEKSLYNKLKNMERNGLGHLTAALIEHRDHFAAEFYNNLDYVVGDLYEVMRNDAIEDRILRSWCAIAAALRTMQNKVNFGFGYSDIRELLIESIRTQNIQTSKSNEIGQFWDLLEAMYDENTLVEGWHFRLSQMDRLKTTTGERTFKDSRTVLRFKFSSIAKLYAENARKAGLKPLPNDTLAYYLKNSKQFIGVQPSVMFLLKEYSSSEGKIVEQKTVTSAYCFDYQRLGINLRRAFVGESLPDEDDSDEKDFLIRFSDKKTNGNDVSVVSEAENVKPLTDNQLPF